MKRQSEVIQLSAASLAGFLLAALILLVPTSAWAVGCPQTIVEVAQTNDIGGWGIHRGTEATGPNGMYVVDRSITCDRVSSIFVFNSVGNGVETGYSEWNSANDSPYCSNNTSTTVPRRLVFLALNDFGYCYPSSGASPSLSADGWHTFSLANGSYDGDFDVFVDHVDVKKWVTGWNDGLSMANTERFNSADSAWGRFDAMEYQAGSGWHSWPHKKCYFDSDHDFDITTGSGGVGHVIIQDIGNDLTCDNR